MFYQQDTRLVPFLAFGMTSESRERVQNTIALIAKGSLLDEFPCVMWVTVEDILFQNNLQKYSQYIKSYSDFESNWHPVWDSWGLELES